MTAADTVEIPLTQGQVALIDRADLELVSSHRWYAQWVVWLARYLSIILCGCGIDIMPGATECPDPGQWGAVYSISAEGCNVGADTAVALDLLAKAGFGTPDLGRLTLQVHGGDLFRVGDSAEYTGVYRPRIGQVDLGSDRRALAHELIHVVDVASGAQDTIVAHEGWLASGRYGVAALYEWISLGRLTFQGGSVCVDPGANLDLEGYAQDIQSRSEAVSRAGKPVGGCGSVTPAPAPVKVSTWGLRVLVEGTGPAIGTSVSVSGVVVGEVIWSGPSSPGWIVQVTGTGNYSYGSELTWAGGAGRVVDSWRF